MEIVISILRSGLLKSCASYQNPFFFPVWWRPWTECLSSYYSTTLTTPCFYLKNLTPIKTHNLLVGLLLARKEVNGSITEAIHIRRWFITAPFRRICYLSSLIGEMENRAQSSGRGFLCIVIAQHKIKNLDN